MAVSARKKLFITLGITCSIILVVLVVVAFVFTRERKENVIARATCALTGSLKGTLVLEEFDDALHIEGMFHTIPFGIHAIHVHEFSFTGGNCYEAGDHYNPTNDFHGGPTDFARHVGDWGNFEVTGTPYMMLLSDHVAKLTGDNSIVNRSIVIHEGPDDLGKGKSTLSLKNGNAGKRLACCVIVEA